MLTVVYNIFARELAVNYILKLIIMALINNVDISIHKYIYIHEMHTEFVTGEQKQWIVIVILCCCFQI